MKENGRDLRMGALCGAAGFLVMLAASACFAWLIQNEILELEHLDLVSAAALILGGLTAGFGCGRGEGKWIQGAVAGVELILVLLTVNLIGFEGSLPGLLPGCVLVLGSVTAAAMTMRDGKSKKRRKYQIKKYRTG